MISCKCPLDQKASQFYANTSTSPGLTNFMSLCWCQLIQILGGFPHHSQDSPNNLTEIGWTRLNNHVPRLPNVEKPLEYKCLKLHPQYLGHHFYGSHWTSAPEKSMSGPFRPHKRKASFRRVGSNFLYHFRLPTMFFFAGCSTLSVSGRWIWWKCTALMGLRIRFFGQTSLY